MKNGLTSADILSTNGASTALRSACGAVWFNTNFNDWASASSIHSEGRLPAPACDTALIGTYQINGKTHFMGMSFGGRVAPLEGPPSLGFHKAELSKDTLGHHP